MTEARFAYIEALRERRFPLVDLERGLVRGGVSSDVWAMGGNTSLPYGISSGWR